MLHLEVSRLRLARPSAPEGPRFYAYTLPKFKARRRWSFRDQGSTRTSQNFFTIFFFLWKRCFDLHLWKIFYLCQTPSQFGQLSVSALVTLMITLLLSGILFALAHHLYYHNLNGRLVNTTNANTLDLFSFSPYSQAWATTIGTAFAFLVQAFLAGAVGVAFTQCAWRTAQSRTIPIDGLDAMWSAPSDVLTFLSWDFISSSRLTTILVFIGWTLPIVSVFTRVL